MKHKWVCMNDPKSERELLRSKSYFQDVENTIEAYVWILNSKHNDTILKKGAFMPNGCEKVRVHTESVFNKIVECVAVTSICEFVVVGRQLLQTLHCNCVEITRIRCILGQHHRASGYKAVYE
jgi:hypothetical protein